MDRQPARRSGLFLMELILSILFFAVAAAICLLLFAKAHSLEADSRNLSQAVNACSSVAEVVRSQDEPLAYLQELYPEGAAGADAQSFFVYYAKDWQVCGSENASYTLTLDLSIEEHLLCGKIQLHDLSDSDKEIYSLTVRRHLSTEVSA